MTTLHASLPTGTQIQRQAMTTAGNTRSAAPMAQAEKRAEFDRDGYLMIRGALGR